jgi:streptogramin lyase
MKNWLTLLKRREGYYMRNLCLILYCFQLLPLTAQYASLPEEYYSVDDGLSDRNILDIVQSQDGIIWLATANGLNRFDGYETLVFNHFPNNEYRIADSFIKNLYLDQKGRLVIVYASTYGMFEILDPITFERETINILPENGVTGIPRMIKVNNEGEILILTHSVDATKIYQYLGDNNFQLLTTVQERREKQSSSINFIQLLNKQYLISDNTLGLRYVAKDGQVLYHFDAADMEGLESDEAYPGVASILHQDQNGRVWYALRSVKGVFNFYVNENAPTVIHFSHASSYGVNLWEDSQGNVLLSWTNDPAQRFPLKKLTCVTKDFITHDFSHLFSASKFIVSAFSKNFFSTIFIGIDTGLKIIQNRQFKIKSLLAEDVESDKRGAVMRGITNVGNSIYFAREFNNWYELDLTDNLFDTLQIIDDKTGLPLLIACGRSIHKDKAGHLWGVTCADGQTKGVLFKYDPATCMATSYVFDHPFSTMTIDDDDVIWLGAEPPTTKGMLLYFDAQTEQFKEFNNSEGINPLYNANPRFIMETSDKMLWVGSENGLYKIDRDKVSVKVYKAMDDESGLASNVIYALYEDDAQNLWIGTTNGFNILSPDNDSIQTFNQKDGLASNIVCGFVPDGQGNTWISTYNGLSFFDSKKKSFRNFFRKDGLTHDEFNRFSYFLGPKGNIYFGGVNGINIFRTEDLLFLQSSPKPIISKITRYNVKKDRTFAQYTNLDKLDKLTILPSDNYFGIHLTMPNYSSPRRNQFKAWLEGYDKKWFLQSKSPVLRYNKLPPGNYTLHIVGTNAYGDWSEEELLLPIFVKPAFYETTWFYLSCLLVAGLVIYLFFQNRLEQRLRMERIRTRLSSDLHDEVSGLLSGIAMQTDVLQMSTANPANKQRLQHIGEVSRKAMSKMSDVIWSIDSRKDKIDELIKRMQEHADEILSPVDIAYQMKVERLDLQRKLPVTLRQNLYFIYKEAINNVAKHSGANKVDILLKNEGNHFIMQVKDNGRSEGQQKINGSRKTGQGLANLKMRAYRIDAQIEFVQQEEGFLVSLKRKKLT